MKQLIYSFFAVLVFLALSAFAEDETNNDSSEGISISKSSGIVSVIANMNTSGNQSALAITEWTYILQDENGNCTSHVKPVLEGNIITNVIDCPKGLTTIEEGDINFTKAVEAIQKSLSNETTYERIFLVKPLNSTEPIWSFKIQEGQTILVGAISGDILKGSQEIRAGQKGKTRLLGASRGGISDTISDVIDTVTDAEYYICVDACIAGCHSLPSDIYSPGYTLDDCISECPDDCKD
jgi:hypothetical protein